MTCPHTGQPVTDCICMDHDTDGAHFRARRTADPTPRAGWPATVDYPTSGGTVRQPADSTPREDQPIIVCVTPDGCTCGAPASTPAGMHHCDCPVHPGWCGQPGCLPCEEAGEVKS